MDAIYLFDTESTEENDRPQTILAIGPITGTTDLGCCTNLTTEGALGLDDARQEAKKRGGTLSLTRVPSLIQRVVAQHH